MTVTRIAIRRPVTVSMFVVAVILFGVVSLQRLALNLLPDISYPSLTIQTDYEDAAPEEIENLITRPIEEAVGVISGLTRLSSISRPGQSEVVLEFGWDTSMDLAGMETREKLDLIEFPEDAGKPVILRFDPSHDPIMRLQLYGDLSLTRLRYLADQNIKKRLEATDGVAAVKVVGGREEQIRIEIDEKRLAELNIPITEVTSTLRQGNVNQAGGSLYDLDANYLVRMLNEFRSVDEIRAMVIRDRDGRAIALGDIAQVWRGTKDRQNHRPPEWRRKRRTGDLQGGGRQHRQRFSRRPSAPEGVAEGQDVAEGHRVSSRLPTRRTSSLRASTMFFPPRSSAERWPR